MNETPTPNRAKRITPQDLQPLPLTHQASIPEDYIDAMGHMNVMWYTHLFGHAIGSTFKLIGLNREYFQAEQAGSFALKQYVNYFNEVREGENISIRSRLLGRSSRRLHVLHFMVKDEANVLAATSEVLITHIDMRVRRASEFPPRIAAAIDRLIAEHAALDWPPPLAGPIQP